MFSPCAWTTPLSPTAAGTSGSGIYRHVRVVVTIPRTSRIGESSSPRLKHRVHRQKSRVTRSVANDSAGSRQSPSKPRLLRPQAGHRDRNYSIDPSMLAASRQGASAQENHRRRSLPSGLLHRPVLYHAVSRVSQRRQIIDEVDTRPSASVRSRGQQRKDCFSMASRSNSLAAASIMTTVRLALRPSIAQKNAGWSCSKQLATTPSGPRTTRLHRHSSMPAIASGSLVLDEPFDVWEAHKVKFDYGSDFDEWWQTRHLLDGPARSQSSLHRDLGHRQRDPGARAGERRWHREAT